MSALQVYSNTNVWYEYIMYISFITINCIIVIQIYLYIVEYMRGTNDEIDKLRRMVSIQGQTIEKYNKQLLRLEEESIQSQIYIQKHAQWISGISKEITGCENQIEKMEEKVNKLLEDNKINIDVMSKIENYMLTLETNINKNMNDIYEIERNNVTDICEIERNILSIRENMRMIPDYVLIGYRFEPSYQIPIPVFVPNDIKIDPEMFKTYQMANCVLFVNHFKYLKNMNYLNLNELDVCSFVRIRFTKCIDPNYDNKDTDILTIGHQHMCASNVGNNSIQSQGGHYYIPSIQDFATRTYFKKGLLMLRSELLRMNIKLILNNDFEEFLR